MATKKLQDPLAKLKEAQNAPLPPGFVRPKPPGVSINVTGAGAKPSGTTTQPPSPITENQKLAGQQFIQAREALVNEFASQGHSQVAARRLANQQIARSQDLTAMGLPQTSQMQTNTSTQQIGVGALGQARERAKAEFPITETPQPAGFTELAKAFIQNPLHAPISAPGATAGLFFAALDVFRQVKSRTFGGNREPLTLQQATESYTEIVGSLRKDIADMNIGLQDPAVVRDKIIMAQNAIGRYESYLKNFNMLNLQYYIDNGAEQQAQLITMRDNLADIRNDFETAKQEWLISQYRQQFLG